MSVNVIDRRLNPTGKSLPNRQRFIRLAKSAIKEAVVRSIRERTLGEVDREQVVNIPVKRIAEPRLRHAATGGDRDRALPGNKEFLRGDTLPKPKGGEGGAGGEASPDGAGEDDFSFTLTREEYLEVLFEELELPDMAKSRLKDAEAVQFQRAGHTPTGTPTNLNLVRTMRHSLARRICLGRPRPEELAALADELRDVDLATAQDEALQAQVERRLEAQRRLQAKMRRVAYIDPVDLRYNRFEARPLPTAQAVMFCLMDVSGSMSEDMKDLAKRFFLLLHLFLSRRYEKIDIVFIRHTSEAREVDEETFFRSRDTGGTVVSSALAEMRRIVEARYPIADWNIFAAQASDGDNYSSDSAYCKSLLSEKILPICQYFAYVEVHEARQAQSYLANKTVSDLWKVYETCGPRPDFAMKRVFNKSDVFPVFHELFAKARIAA